MLSATRSDGGCGTILAKGAAKPHSIMSLIPLWLSLLIGLTRADPGKSGRTIATHRKPGGHVAPIAARCSTPLSGPMRGRYRPH